jgi:uncharacterized protein (DUF983 family)
MLSKEELERYRELLIKEISVTEEAKLYKSPFLKECPHCKNKFKDFLEKRTICLTCEREQKLNDLGI